MSNLLKNVYILITTHLLAMLVGFLFGIATFLGVAGWMALQDETDETPDTNPTTE